MFHLVILNDIKRLLNQSVYIKLQFFYIFFPNCFGSANITVGQRRFVFSSKKPPRSSDHIDLNCIFMDAKAPKAELRFSF